MTPLAQAVVDLLRSKKAEGGERHHAAPAATKIRTPAPEMLGSGGAQRAAVELLRRKTAPMDYVDNLK